MCSSQQEREKQRVRETNKRPGSLALTERQASGQWGAPFLHVPLVILLAQALGVPVPGFCGYLVEEYADASAHSVRETKIAVGEGCLRYCAWGWPTRVRE